MGRKQFDQSVRERVEAFIQPMPAHEIAPIDLQARYTLEPRASRALVIVVAILGMIVVLGLGIGWFRESPVDDTQPPTDPLLAQATSPTPSAGSAVTAVPHGLLETSSSEPQATVPTEVVISVQGLVEKPGLLRLPNGMRVGEAIDRAGGPSHTASLHRVNLAEIIHDGMQILVDEHGSSVALSGSSLTGPAPAGSTSAGGGQTNQTHQASTAGTVNINTATAAELEELPGVGPATAQAIITHRDSNGPFTAVEDLLQVRGIGPAKFDAIKDLAVI